MMVTNPWESRLHGTTMLALLLLWLSIAGNVFAVWHSRSDKMHYTTVGSGVSVAGQFPTEVMVDMAKNAARLLGNVAPESILAHIEEIRPYMLPEIYVALLSQVQKELPAMKTANLMIQNTDVHLDRVTKLNGPGDSPVWRVILKARRRISATGSQLLPHDVSIIVDVQQPTNAYPMRITHVRWPELRIKDGKFQDFNLPR